MSSEICDPGDVLQWSHVHELAQALNERIDAFSNDDWDDQKPQNLGSDGDSYFNVNSFQQITLTYEWTLNYTAGGSNLVPDEVVHKIKNGIPNAQHFQDIGNDNLRFVGASPNEGTSLNTPCYCCLIFGYNNNENNEDQLTEKATDGPANGPCYTSIDLSDALDTGLSAKKPLQPSIVDRYHGYTLQRGTTENPVEVEYDNKVKLTFSGDNLTIVSPACDPDDENVPEPTQTYRFTWQSNPGAYRLESVEWDIEGYWGWIAKASIYNEIFAKLEETYEALTCEMQHCVVGIFVDSDDSDLCNEEDELSYSDFVEYYNEQDNNAAINDDNTDITTHETKNECGHTAITCDVLNSFYRLIDELRPNCESTESTGSTESSQDSSDEPTDEPTDEPSEGCDECTTADGDEVKIDIQGKTSNERTAWFVETAGPEKADCPGQFCDDDNDVQVDGAEISNLPGWGVQGGSVSGCDSDPNWDDPHFIVTNCTDSWQRVKVEETNGYDISFSSACNGQICFVKPHLYIGPNLKNVDITYNWSASRPCLPQRPGRVTEDVDVDAVQETDPPSCANISSPEMDPP